MTDRARAPRGCRARPATLPLLLLLALCVACMPPSDETSRSPTGPATPGVAAAKAAIAPGLKEIVAGRATALLYVPTGYRPDTPMPLVVMLHGAGGTARHGIDLVKKHADDLGFLLLAPKSRAVTWDIIAERRFGADASALDAFVGQALRDYGVDTRRIAVSGFSDGASYALSVGLDRGEAFSDIIAFSPGFMAPERARGRPTIFISHGVADRVLPIESCSRRIVPQLQRAGYRIRYVEFPGGHNVPGELARQALQAFVDGGARQGP